MLGLRGRDPAAALSAWPFAMARRLAAGAPRAAETAASARLLAYARVRRDGGAHRVEVLARFDPLRPPEPGDESLAERYNEALAGGGGKRQREFGSARPLLLELTLEARDAAGQAVPIARNAAAAGARAVVVRNVERGEATAFVGLNLPAQPRRREGFGAAISVGRATLDVPAGVTVTGTARIQYAGTTQLSLRATEVAVGFRVPAPGYADEWQLIQAVLNEVDGGSAASRLRALREQACAPLPSDCTLDQFADDAASRAAQPAGRWAAVHHQADPDRTFARFVRHMAVAFAWDGEVEFEEYARLSRLFAKVYAVH